jgi:hypothetical protein
MQNQPPMQQMQNQPPIQQMQQDTHSIPMQPIKQNSELEDSISKLEKQLQMEEPRKNYFLSMDFFMFALKLLLVLIIILCCYFLFRKRN